DEKPATDADDDVGNLPVKEKEKPPPVIAEPKKNPEPKEKTEPKDKTELKDKTEPKERAEPKDKTEPKNKPDNEKDKRGDKPPPVVEVVVPPAPIAPGVDAERIDAAVVRGVKYLKEHQQDNGSWPGPEVHPLGIAALGGLALLECSVPADDARVQRVAQ